ncbi:MAG TPA: hypothetical protein V6C97_19470 [Oculatellaceae cyanobacterium]
MKDQTGSVLMLSGPVAAGKTTVAKLLIPMLPGAWAYLEGDIFWSFMVKSEQRPRQENFQLIMRSMTAAAKPLARGGFNVLLDFSFPPEFIPVAQKILKEVPLNFVSLRPTLGVCSTRAADRAEGKIEDYTVYRSFYTLFQNTTAAQINNDQASAAKIAELVTEGFTSNRFLRPARPGS